MIDFETFGPFELPTEKRNAGRRIQGDLSEFWGDHDDMRTRIGCYVFSIKTGRANVPYYVGMTTASFEDECFTPHKLDHYHDALIDYVRGKPMMSFITCKLPRATPSVATIDAIGELETFLIQTAVRANSKLRNRKGAKGPNWSIQGIVRGNAGRRNHSQIELAKMLRLSK